MLNISSLAKYVTIMTKYWHILYVQCMLVQELWTISSVTYSKYLKKIYITQRTPLLIERKIVKKP